MKVIIFELTDIKELQTKINELLNSPLIDKIISIHQSVIHRKFRIDYNHPYTKENTGECDKIIISIFYSEKL